MRAFPIVAVCAVALLACEPFLPHLPPSAELHGGGCKVWFANEQDPQIGYYSSVSDDRSRLHAQQDAEGPSMASDGRITYNDHDLGTFSKGVLAIGDFTADIVDEEPQDGSFTIVTAWGNRKFLIQYNARCNGAREIALGTAGMVLLLDADLKRSRPLRR